MKKGMTLITIVAMAISCFAEGHMKFKGIEMTGTAVDFARQLEQKGYINMGSMNNTTILTGTFAGYNQCNIMVLGKTDGKLTKVTVMFPSSESWSNLYETYSILKKNLTEKYGAPVKENMDWNDKYNHEPSDNMKYTKIQLQEAKVGTYYITEQGEIDLEIKGSVSGGCFVFLSYFDLASQRETIKSVQEDL